MNELQLIIPKDCGNSPKKNHLKNFNIALVKQDIPFIVDSVADDIVWNIVGKKIVRGKDGFMNLLKKEDPSLAIKLEINEIITHGNVASANGSVELKND